MVLSWFSRLGDLEVPVTRARRLLTAFMVDDSISVGERMAVGRIGGFSTV